MGVVELGVRAPAEDDDHVAVADLHRRVESYLGVDLHRRPRRAVGQHGVLEGPARARPALPGLGEDDLVAGELPLRRGHRRPVRRPRRCGALWRRRRRRWRTPSCRSPSRSFRWPSRRGRAHRRRRCRSAGPPGWGRRARPVRRGPASGPGRPPRRRARAGGSWPGPAAAHLVGLGVEHPAVDQVAEDVLAAQRGQRPPPVDEPAGHRDTDVVGAVPARRRGHGRTRRPGTCSRTGRRRRAAGAAGRRGWWRPCRRRRSPRARSSRSCRRRGPRRSPRRRAHRCVRGTSGRSPGPS